MAAASVFSAAASASMARATSLPHARRFCRCRELLRAEAGEIGLQRGHGAFVIFRLRLHPLDRRRQLRRQHRQQPHARGRGVAQRAEGARARGRRRRTRSAGRL